MKNKKHNYNGKSILSRCSSILLILALISVFSCAPLQYSFDARENSKFSTFDNLGIAKEDFIKQYGQPTNKGLYQQTQAKKVEKLYYTEKIKDFLVTTEFIFENNILKQMERVETRNNFQEIREHLEMIK
ncbi:hypothetical protein [Gelidibacter salicanalis]|uniref:Uncharacterized protein n=1 Tax=Gelidibacter salicanalis TaxID=291193 RepID=A0A934NHA9_9FLAO|nr:hypothetical protein [Gelidibacter salicanalis]MBJ7880621.1 hypothetical protein [Gelidibacter salicanalis]